MSTHRNTNFTINAPKPIDSRMQRQTQADLSTIAVKYDRMPVYILGDDTEWRWFENLNQWVEIVYNGSGTGEVYWQDILGDPVNSTSLTDYLAANYATILHSHVPDDILPTDSYLTWQYPHVAPNYILTGSDDSNPGGGSGASYWTDLLDTASSYSGYALGFPQVNSAENGLQLITFDDSIGSRVRFKGTWVNATYQRNDWVISGNWMGVSLENNNADVFPPYQDGSPQWLLPSTPVWETLSNVSDVFQGLEFYGVQFNTVDGFRVWSNGNPAENFRLFAYEVSSTGATTFLDFFDIGNNLPAGWNVMTLNKFGILQPQQKYRLVLETHTATNTTTLEDDWVYAPGDDTPTAGDLGITVDGIHINQVSDNATDQSAFLDGLVADDDILVEESGDSARYSAYRIVTVDPKVGNVYHFETILTAQGNEVRDGRDITVRFQSKGVLVDTSYNRIVDQWPVLDTLPDQVQGFVTFDADTAISPTPGLNNNAYGLDLFYDTYVISPKWYYIGIGDATSNAGGGGTDIEIVDNLTTQDATKALSANQGYILDQKILAIPPNPDLTDYMTKTEYASTEAGKVDVAINSENLGGELPAFYDQNAHVAVVEGNPHMVTTTELGLENVDNTSDIDKPISTLQAAEFATKLDGVLQGTGIIIDYPISALEPRVTAVPTATAGIINQFWFTGDEEVTTEDTFFKTSVTDKGTVADAPQTLALADDQKGFYPQDLLGDTATAVLNISSGIYTGFLTTLADVADGSQEFTVELYLCDDQGAPKDSGITGAPVGDLGVPVLMLATSGTINLPAGILSQVSWSGSIQESVQFQIGDRIRYHVSAQKVGTDGGVVNMTIHYGSDNFSYISVPAQVKTSDVVNDSTVTGTTASDALETNALAISEHVADTDVHFSTDERDAMDAANAPSSTNAIATIADIGTGGGVPLFTVIIPVPADYTTDSKNDDNKAMLDVTGGGTITLDENALTLGWEQQAVNTGTGNFTLVNGADSTQVPPGYFAYYILVKAGVWSVAVAETQTGVGGGDVYLANYNEFTARNDFNGQTYFKNQAYWAIGTSVYGRAEIYNNVFTIESLQTRGMTLRSDGQLNVFAALGMTLQPTGSLSLTGSEVNIAGQSITAWSPFTADNTFTAKDKLIAELNPVTDTEVGNLGFNDDRYARPAFNTDFTAELRASGNSNYVGWDSTLVANLGYLYQYYRPITESGVAGETMSPGDIVYQNDQTTYTWFKASANIEAQVSGRLGIVVEGSAVGGDVAIGSYLDVAIAPNLAKELVYLGTTPGTYVIGIPPAGGYTRVIGSTISSTIIHFNVDAINWIKTDGSEINGVPISTGGSGGGDFYVQDGDGTQVTIAAGSTLNFIEGGGVDVNFTDVTGPVFGLTVKHVDTSSFAMTPLSGSKVISQLTADTYGHVLTAVTRDLSLSDMSDVSQVAPASLELLARNATNTGWENRTLTELGIQNYTHPNHYGQVTSNSDKETALTVSAITAQTNGTVLAGTDEIIYSDDGVLKRLDLDYLIKGFSDIGASIVGTDELMISDSGTIKRTDVSRLITYLEGSFLRKNVADNKTVGDLIMNDNIGIAFGTGFDSRMFWNETGSRTQLALTAGDFVIADNSAVRFTFERETGFFSCTKSFATSSRELKKNIFPWEDSGMDLINQIGVVTYDFKDESSFNNIGAIAEDVPNEIAADDKKSIDMNSTTFALVKAVQELYQEIERLKEIINEIA